ncbi:MAG: LPXTG cell wall anchor domain-containing protein [Frankiaceae bacterium]|nr:LPXTG cell wall anchor domain-containing protein [Frankiaceae bacterium]MBV9368218.1 LPXTG cell wall anchor domain-containing protein [Frankiales bacterium]
MTTKQALATVVLATTGILAPTAAAAAAPAACDAYSHKCTHVEGTKIVRHPTVDGTGTKLPFTGAEVVGMSIVGLGALGAGTAFVIAGRRRRTAEAV